MDLTTVEHGCPPDDARHSIMGCIHVVSLETEWSRIRGLEKVSAFEPDCNLVEIISPTKADKCPCIIVNVQYLSDELKQSLTGHAAEERLIQFVGDLSLPADRERYHLTAFASSFMDGVDLNIYTSVAKITRSYVKHLPALS
ncbi:hypothetical protein PHET_02742 [Paragonimus heterotremus]|uniref:Uncharacterized protein n=1 Tax=Paragonimus heterotremus TaxID=100268 RepID=A0A8J4WJJ4_9TREM|nr:hypothetical protein PHET_02742 [Paragonimus heterotremus]